MLNYFVVKNLSSYTRLKHCIINQEKFQTRITNRLRAKHSLAKEET
jgi:hypothetical protein